jgi:XTP/dITP diphosphohydrolase
VSSAAELRRIVVASSNPGKVREFQMALDDLDGWVIDPLPPGISTVDETGATFIANASLKAVHYSGLVGGIVLADDSGLCVDALHDAPGLHSARYGPTAEARNHRVLSELNALRDPDRKAKFVCALALARAGVVFWTTEAQLPGRITNAPVGAFGFGYDPIFYLPELKKTLAEMTAEEKNRWSARGRAVANLRQFLALATV